MNEEERREAALKRAGQAVQPAGSGYRAAADRPRQRRDGEALTCPARVTVRTRNLQLRASTGADDGLLTYEGWASVTDAPYEMWDWAGPYTEVVTPGAFAKTLTQVGLDVPLVLQHDSLRRIARTTNGSLQLEEDTTGLHVLADQLDAADADVAYIAPKLRSGLIDEMSFKFMITKGSWSSDWTEYHIDEVDIHRGDVAIVAYGANPATAGSGLRAPGVDFTGLTEAQARAMWLVLGERFTGQKSRITDEDVKIRTL